MNRRKSAFSGSRYLLLNMEMIMKHLNKQHTAIVSILIFSIGIAFSNNVFSDKPVRPAKPTLSTYYAVGDTGPAGGVVFEVSVYGLHGMEAAPEGLLGGGQWGCYDTEIVGADGTAVGTGAQNTVDILAGCNDSERPPEAAEFADNYVLNGYTDWFLPSLDEVIAMYQSPYLQSNFAVWSSTESTDPLFGPDRFAMAVYFSSGLIVPDPKNVPYQAWPIRAF